MKQARFFIEYMIQNIEWIEQFTDGISFEEFARTQEKISAVERQFEVMGQCMKDALLKDPTLPEKMGEIPWREIIGMRDILAHEYYDIDFRTLWKTIQKDLPPLKKVLKQYLEQNS